MSERSTRAIILAGGQSSRMGQDKAEVKVDGERLIEIAIRRLWVQDCEIVVSAPHDYGTGLKVIPDIIEGPRGPVAAIFAAYKDLENHQKIEGFVTVPVDSPNFPDDLVKNLKSDTHSQIAAGPNRIHPTLGWWRMADLKSVFETDISDGKISLTALAQKIGAKSVTWTDQTLFLNINDPNDLNAYLTLKSLPHKEP